MPQGQTDTDAIIGLLANALIDYLGEHAIHDGYVTIDLRIDRSGSDLPSGIGGLRSAIIADRREHGAEHSQTTLTVGVLDMTTQQNVDYFLAREAEERMRAARANNLAVHDAHFQLAERYADAASSAEEWLASPVRASGLWPPLDQMST